MYAFVKGSPEMMASICDKSTFSVDNFNDKLTFYANLGYRIIAFGYKEVLNKSV